jgi:hypothetical protein
MFHQQQTHQKRLRQNRQIVSLFVFTLAKTENATPAKNAEIDEQKIA